MTNTNNNTRTNQPTIRVMKAGQCEDLPLPTYATAGAAGADLFAAVSADTPVLIAPMQRVCIDTGVSFAIPKGYEAQIRPRSGLALRHGITVLNAPATIDSDYRGEIKVLLINLGTTDYLVSRGDRIAQVVIAAVEQGRFEECSELDDTRRGQGGFGSSGTGILDLQDKGEG